jgi:hypothetical protein
MADLCRLLVANQVASAGVLGRAIRFDSHVLPQLWSPSRTALLRKAGAR